MEHHLSFPRRGKVNIYGGFRVSCSHTLGLAIALPAIGVFASYELSPSDFLLIVCSLCEIRHLSWLRLCVESISPE